MCRIVYDMSRSPGEPSALFWAHVRARLHAYLRGEALIEGRPSRWSQSAMAEVMALSPQALTNFLADRNHSLGGLAIARACSAGMEFECEDSIIGRIDAESRPTATREPDQLVLEFSDSFEMIQGSGPLLVALRKGPHSAGRVQKNIRLTVASNER